MEVCTLERVWDCWDCDTLDPCCCWNMEVREVDVGGAVAGGGSGAAGSAFD